MRWQRLVASSVLLLVTSCTSPTAPSTTTSTSTSPPSSTSPSPIALTGLSIGGTATVRGRNRTTQLNAQARYSDGSTVEKTSAVEWSSSNATVAEVSSAGLVRANGFGVVDIIATFEQRRATLSITVAPLTIAFRVFSQGACGYARFERDGVPFWSKTGCSINGARGFNVAVVNRTTGELMEPVQNFDTWYEGEPAAARLVDFLDRQPQGALLLIAVGDEAGLTVGRTAGCPRDPQLGTVCCTHLGGQYERVRAALELLGARQIRRYCYWNSYSLIAIKGQSAIAEQLQPLTSAMTEYTLTVD